MRLETAAPAAAKAKKELDQTRVIPQGVKLDELTGSGSTAPFETKGFEKKSNKGAKIFLIIVIVVGLVLVAALAFVLFVKN